MLCLLKLVERLTPDALLGTSRRFEMSVGSVREFAIVAMIGLTTIVAHAAETNILAAISRLDAMGRARIGLAGVVTNVRMEITPGKEISNPEKFTAEELEQIKTLLHSFGVNTDTIIRAYNNNNGALLATHIAESKLIVFTTAALTPSFQGNGNELWVYQQLPPNYQLAAELRDSNKQVLKVISTSWEAADLLEAGFNGKSYFPFSNRTAPPPKSHN